MNTYITKSHKSDIKFISVRTARAAKGGVVLDMCKYNVKAQSGIIMSNMKLLMMIAEV
jgi:hypothetical protein